MFDSTASTYRVTGTTARALVAAMRAKGLRDDAGDSAFALTSWFVSWSYDYDKGADSCAIDGLAVRLKITVLLPRWDAPPGTDAELVARWGRYIDALRLHERGHELNGLDRAEEVRDDLLELGSRSSCAALERAADAAGDLVIEAGQAWDRTYDDTTDHGATQGAVFP